MVQLQDIGKKPLELEQALSVVLKACDTKAEQLDGTIEDQISHLSGLLAKTSIEKEEADPHPTPLTNDEHTVSRVVRSTAKAAPYVTPTKRVRGPKKAYVVFVGLQPGVHENWCDVAKYVLRIPGAVYQGFPSVAEAQAAYHNACENGSAFKIDKQGRLVTM